MFNYSTTIEYRKIFIRVEYSIDKCSVEKIIKHFLYKEFFHLFSFFTI